MPMRGRSRAGCGDARNRYAPTFFLFMRDSASARPARAVALAALLATVFALPAARAELVAVSPGETSRSVEAASACPTFSWSAAAGATGYELAVLRLDRQEEPETVWIRTVAGSATSWSPSRSDCLEAGGRYAWTVRALGPVATSAEPDWAEARRFEVPDAPDDDEVAAALATLERWRRAQGEIAGGAAVTDGPGRSVKPALRRTATDAAGGGAAVEVATGVAAIRGENPDSSGNAFGVLGLSHSPTGAGLVARNESAGADLVLDGEANGASDTLLRQDSLDRPSANSESFDFRNSGAGVMALKIDGVDVVTTATDQDTLGALSCPDGQIAKRVAGLWQCAADADRLTLLACASGEIAKMDPGANWSCAADDDALANLSCTDGQIAKRVSGSWACAPDDTGSAGIWTSYSEGSDVRVFNAQGNRVGIGNRAMQPVGSLPSEDGALTVVHSATQPLTTEYSLTMDGRGLQARSRSGIFDPLQDAPLLINRYGGGVSIGKEAAPTRAAIEAQGAVGNTMATFQRNAGGQGIALVGDWPGLYANSYFNNGVQTMAGTGYSQLINFDQVDGAISFMTSTAPNTLPDVPAVTLQEQLRLEKDGRLTSPLTLGQFNIAPVAAISIWYWASDDGAGGLTFQEQYRRVRSAFPVTFNIHGLNQTRAYLDIDFSPDIDSVLFPIVAQSALSNYTFEWAPTRTAVLRDPADVTVTVEYDFGLAGRLWKLQLLIFGAN